MATFVVLVVSHVNSVILRGTDYAIYHRLLGPYRRKGPPT